MSGARLELGVLGLRATEKKLLLAVPSWRSGAEAGRQRCWLLYVDLDAEAGDYYYCLPGAAWLHMYAHANAKVCVPG